MTVTADLYCHPILLKRKNHFNRVNNCNELYQFNIVKLPDHLFHCVSQHDVDAVIKWGTYVGL